MAASGRRLIVVDQGEMTDDLVQDMVDVMTSFCARLYGRRSAKNRADRAIAAAAALKADEAAGAEPVDG